MSHHDRTHAITSRLRETVLKNLGAQEQPDSPPTRVRMPRSGPQWAAFAARILAEMESLPEPPSSGMNLDDDETK